MVVKWSEKASACLEEIASYIALDSVERAYSFRDELIGAARKIADFPQSGALRMIGKEQVRIKVHKGYVISYQVEEDEVLIRYVHKENIPRL